MKTKWIVASLAVAAGLAAFTPLAIQNFTADSTPSAWVYSCAPTLPNGNTLYPANQNFWPVQFSGTVQEASDWVASHQGNNSGCWQTMYTPPTSVDTTTTTTTSTTTTSTTLPTTTTTSTTLPTTTTTTIPWPPDCNKYCQNHYKIYCPKHAWLHGKYCAPINGAKGKPNG